MHPSVVQTQLVFLGTGTPNPNPRRSGPAAAVVAGENAYLVDCGPGIVRRAAKAAARGVDALKMKGLTKLFITHLHSDHTVGLPDLIFTPAVTGRRKPLEIWGPPGTEELVTHVMVAWHEDIQTRLSGGEPTVPEAYSVTAKAFSPGTIYDDETVRVSACRVLHGTWKHAFALRFDSVDRSIVFSGDTTYCPALANFANGCDVLVHEAYSAKGLANRTKEWQAYHTAFHTSGADVGRIATAVRPKLLLLNHLLPFGEPEDQIVEEVRSTYDGDVQIAEDLGVY